MGTRQTGAGPAARRNGRRTGAQLSLCLGIAVACQASAWAGKPDEKSEKAGKTAAPAAHAEAAHGGAQPAAAGGQAQAQGQGQAQGAGQGQAQGHAQAQAQGGQGQGQGQGQAHGQPGAQGQHAGDHPGAQHAGGDHAQDAHRGGPGGQHPGERHEFHDHDTRHFGADDLHRWRDGRWDNRCFDGRCGWWWTAGGQWYFYDRPTYPYPVVVSGVEFVEPVVVVQEAAAPVVVAPAPAPAPVLPPPPKFYYYCDNPAGYYPAVQTCSTKFRQVSSPTGQ